ncbi:Chorion peroxidase [Hypsibius exemplaris]|uniref:Chorion peroxidase n=1 Tax=Hypsibius exemplaris TaxID=2072580 RepID=A0A1W0WZB4_HYPEX|nr:Chorion peroxidase [Hypsibius exemplaris]
MRQPPVGCFRLCLTVGIIIFLTVLTVTTALRREECCDGEDGEEAPAPPRPHRNGPPSQHQRRVMEQPTEEDAEPGFAPRPLQRRPPKKVQRRPQMEEEDDDDDDDDDAVVVGGPPGRRQRPAQRMRNGTIARRRNSQRLKMTGDRVTHTGSQSIRRAIASGVDLNVGLADNYRIPRHRNNRTLAGRHQPELFLNQQDRVAGLGHIPNTDASVYDVPRSGYPVIRSVTLKEGEDALPKDVPVQQLADAVDDANELARGDFRAIIMRHREPRCIIGDYGQGGSVHPLSWITAQGINIAEYAYENEFSAIRLSNGLVKGKGDVLYSTLRKAAENGYQPSDDCYVEDQRQCNVKTPYRTFDGSCNNVNNRLWGAAMTGEIHATHAAYEDGIAAPRDFSVTSIINQEPTFLPSAREVSISISQPGMRRSDRKITMMVFQLGQLVAHDLMNTPVDLVENPAKKGDWILPACCGMDQHNGPNCQHPSCYPIKIPPNDPFYGQYQLTCMEFVRSQPANPRTCDLTPRQPVNINSHFLDASAVYGSRLQDSMKLRGPRGTLSINEITGPSCMMSPAGPDSMSCHAAGEGRPCMMSGDSRVNQHTGVISMSSLYIREHNRIARYISDSRPGMPDEVIFQVARRIVIAQHQHIVYNELLPTLLGNRIYSEPSNGLQLTQNGYCKDCYYDTVNPSISVEFGAAAYRLHTLVPNHLPTRDASGGFPPLYEHMLNPEMFYRPGIVDELLQALVQHPAESFDPLLSGALQNHLFQMKTKPYGQDQHSLNIQRGRDQGVPSYAEVRKACGYPEVQSFADLEDLMPPRAVQQLASIYKHVLDIDLYAGGISEFPVNGGDGVVGPTFACIITDQFARLRHGDRFWYENKEAKFTKAQLQEIRKTSLAALLCLNTPAENMQPRALLLDSARNPVLSCDDLMPGFLNLDPFLEDLSPSKAETVDITDLAAEAVLEVPDHGMDPEVPVDLVLGMDQADQEDLGLGTDLEDLMMDQEDLDLGMAPEDLADRMMGLEDLDRGMDLDLADPDRGTDQEDLGRGTVPMEGLEDPADPVSVDPGLDLADLADPDLEDPTADLADRASLDQPTEVLVVRLLGPSVVRESPSRFKVPPVHLAARRTLVDGQPVETLRKVPTLTGTLLGEFVNVQNSPSGAPLKVSVSGDGSVVVNGAAPVKSSAPVGEITPRPVLNHV